MKQGSGLGQRTLVWAFFAITGGIGGDVAWASPEISGRVGNETAYFLEEDRSRIRQHRYEMKLQQKVPFSFRLSTVTEARFRYDPALANHDSAPQRDLPKEVRANERTEGELRQAYIDYLGDQFRLTVGLQLIDWVESLSPLANDMLTPLDLRQGGFGDPAEIIVPRGSVNFSLKLWATTFELMVAPYAPHSRLPAAENGYGLYQAAYDLVDDVPLTIAAEKNGYGADQTEVGARWLVRFGSVEGTLLGYRGRQTRPIAAIENIQQGREFELTFQFPMTTTYGLSLAYAPQDSGLNTRFSVFHQPRRLPPYIVTNFKRTPYEKRSRVGLGLDYVFSKHFKFYSDQLFTRAEVVPELFNPYSDAPTGNDSDDDDDDLLLLDQEGAVTIDNPREDYSISFRLLNESFNDIALQLEGIWTSPRQGLMLGPEIRFFLGESYRIAVGARFLRSYDRLSAFAPLSKASTAYLSVFKHFGLVGEGDL